MSIYGTMRDWTIGEHSVMFQRVAGDIDDVGPAWDWLGPNTPNRDWDETRAVFVIDACHTAKGTGRNGQEYIWPLMRMTIEEYDAAMETPQSRNRLRTQLRRDLVSRLPKHEYAMSAQRKFEEER
jgi:hypothetical protein